MTVSVALPTFKCVRCKHEWVPRKPERSMTCASCRSPYWDVPRKAKKRAGRV